MILISGCRSVPPEPSPIPFPEVSSDYPARPVLRPLPAVEGLDEKVLPLLNAYNHNMGSLVGYTNRIENFADSLLKHIDILKELYGPGGKPSPP